MTGIVYIITNKINGKQYIGKTYYTLEERFCTHKSEAKKYIKRPLYRAFNKYGIENFTIKQLGEFEQDILEQKEIQYIKVYQTYQNGYNATLGGDGKRYFEYSDEHVIKLFKKSNNIQQVARELGCNRKTVERVLKNNNIKRKNKVKPQTKPKKENKISSKLANEIMTTYKEVKKIAPTARKSKCSQKVVRTVLLRNGIF